MKLSLIESILVKKYIKKLIEARDDSFADYEVKKDKVIATLKRQKASAFTKLADEWTKFDKLQEELSNEKRKLNEKVQAAKDMEADLKDRIREKVVNIFDESEQAMSLAVHCLNSTFTVSKLTAENLPTTVAKAGDYIDTNYQKVVELLLEQTPDLSNTINLLIKQCSTIAVEDIVKPGAKRRAGISTSESILKEGPIWDKVVNIYNKIAAKIKGYFNLLDARKKRIDQLLMLIGK